MQTVSKENSGKQSFVHNGVKIYDWEQTLEDVHIYFVPPQGATKRDFDITISSNFIKIGLKGNPPFLQEAPGSKVNSEDSFWMLEDGILHIQLAKAHKGDVWKTAIAGHNCLDSFSEEEVKKKLMLERFQEENPGFDFSGASFSGAAPDPRSFMGGVKYD